MKNIRTLKILSAILILGAIYWFGLRTDPRVDALNQALVQNSSPALRNYPYSFRVIGLEGGSAVMSTPRSAEVPVLRMIGALYPNLSGKAPNDPDFVAAEIDLSKVQFEARTIVLSQPGVTSVKWELDRNWLIAHNIQIN
jgi:hypothetical protein